MNNYEIGDLVQVTANFVDVNNSPIDPTNVTCQYVSTKSSAATASVTKVSTGIYTAQIPCAVDGNYAYRFLGTGAAQASNEGAFVVNPSSVLGI
jgi:hypothetical protein